MDHAWTEIFKSILKKILKSSIKKMELKTLVKALIWTGSIFLFDSFWFIIIKVDAPIDAIKAAITDYKKRNSSESPWSRNLSFFSPCNLSIFFQVIEWFFIE